MPGQLVTYENAALSVCLFPIDSKTTEPITMKTCTLGFSSTGSILKILVLLYLINVGKGGGKFVVHERENFFPYNRANLYPAVFESEM